MSTHPEDRRFHFDHVDDLLGIAAEKGVAGSPINVITRATCTSDDVEFHGFMEAVTSNFLAPMKIVADLVYRLLVVIHQDLSADLYVNGFDVQE